MIREEYVGERWDFQSLFGFELASVEDFLTFPKLVGAPDYSLAGHTYLGAPAIETFAGRPWEVMAKNKLVYNFETDELVPYLSVTNVCGYGPASKYLSSNGLILPGSLVAAGRGRVVDYVAWFSKHTMSFKYSEVSYV